jgi:D-threonate/D-erythronate kinase
VQSEGNGGLGLFAIADDLTGALEIGAKFAAHDLGATVVTELDVRLDSSCFALIVDLETRHVAAEEAVARTKQVANLAHDSAVRLFYLKTDSTLRGNIAAEFRAIEQIFPERRIVYVPAYPDMGRTVRNGQLFVHGKLVHETEFANDRWSPVRDCRIRNVLGDVQAVILDGECNRDIELAARGIMEGPPPQVCAGPAALAGALAKRIGAKTKPRITCPAVSRCLVVNGSLHPTSLQQMAFAEKSGFFDENWKALDETVEGSGSERALRTGECVRRILRSARFDALIVFGGDTAFGIHRSLGSEPFQAIGEIAPGVAVSRSSNLLWITKAGGFGPPDILARIRKRLT